MPPLTETPSVFMQDFGVPVVFGSYTTTGVLDSPDEDVVTGHSVSRQYALTYQTAALPGLGNGSVITVSGITHTVLFTHATDDGIFSSARLSR